jgi:hypothetical protein
MSRLRDDVCAAVEAEIQNEVIEYEISDEEYLEVSHSAWARMYSVAVQYHQSGLKPMGLIVDQTGRSGKCKTKLAQKYFKKFSLNEHYSVECSVPY